MLWRNAIELASCFGLNFVTLAAVFSLSSSLTDTYLSALLAYARNSTYKKFTSRGICSIHPEDKLRKKHDSTTLEIAQYYPSVTYGVSKEEFLRRFGQSPYLIAKYFCGSEGFELFTALAVDDKEHKVQKNSLEGCTISYLIGNSNGYIADQ